MEFNLKRATDTATFAAAIAAVPDSRIAQLDYYTRKLRGHDWAYEYSDDGSVWQRGRDERKVLVMLAKALDPAYVIWNNIAPRAHWRKVEGDDPIITQRIKELM